MKINPLGILQGSVGSANSFFNGDPSSVGSSSYQFPGYSDSAGLASRLLNPSEHENQQMENELFMMDYENKLARENWQMAADWNSVGSQIQRAIEAGVNPNYALGAQANDQVNPVAAPSHSMPAGMAFSAGDMANSVNSLLSGGSHAAQSVNSIIDAIFKPQKTKAEIKQINSIVSKNLADVNLSRSERKKVERLLEPMYEKLVADKESAVAGIEQIQKMIEKYDAEIKNLEHTNELIDAQTGETKEKRRLYAAQSLEQELENAFRKTFGFGDGEGWITALSRLVLSGHGKEVNQMLADFLKTFGESLPSVIGAPFIGLFDGLFGNNSPFDLFGDSLSDGLKDLVKQPWFKDLVAYLNKVQGNEQNNIDRITSEKH